MLTNEILVNSAISEHKIYVLSKLIIYPLAQSTIQPGDNLFSTIALYISKPTMQASSYGK